MDYFREFSFFFWGVVGEGGTYSVLKFLVLWGLISGGGSLVYCG